MGAWNSGNFDNDDAMDFVNLVTHQDGLRGVEEVFDLILRLDDYIDVDFCSAAVVAGEVVAILRGKPSKDVPDSLMAWYYSHQLSVDNMLLAKAIQAVEKAFADNGKSELRDLWRGSDKFSTVEANIADLLSRLRS